MKKFLTSFFISFFLVPSSFAKDISYQTLIELGYSKTFFYKENYNRSNAKWFDLKEVIEQNPKYLALVEQNIKVNGNFVDYKFVYSSKHNFFKFINTEVENKNYILDKVSFLKKKFSVPEEINDQNISEKEFIESVLDHCTYAPLKNVKDPETKKKIIFKKFDTCKIKFLNTKNMNDLTLETFTENEKNKTTDKNKNKKTTEKKIINSEKKSKIKKEKKVDETKNTKKL